MTGEPGTKRCEVAYATRERQFSWTIELPREASVAEALDAARRGAACAEIPWETADVGIYGEPCARSHVPADGDRIEIYRPLVRDPRQARLERVQRSRGRKV